MIACWYFCWYLEKLQTTNNRIEAGCGDFFNSRRPMPQQECQQALLGLPLQMLHILACLRQIAQRFLRTIRYPYRRQFPRPMQPCQRQTIAPVGLDTITSFLRNQRRRNYLAIPTEIS